MLSLFIFNFHFLITFFYFIRFILPFNIHLFISFRLSFRYFITFWYFITFRYFITFFFFIAFFFFITLTFFFLIIFFLFFYWSWFLFKNNWIIVINELFPMSINICNRYRWSFSGFLPFSLQINISNELFRSNYSFLDLTSFFNSDMAIFFIC